MSGRHWRHFAPEWPHMVAGLFGQRASSVPRARSTPQETGASSASHPSASPSSASPAAREAAVSTGCPATREAAAEEVPGDGWGDVVDDVDEEALSIAGPDMLPGSEYRLLFGGVPLEDAVLHMFWQAARVNNLLFGDNHHAADGVMTDASAMLMARQAYLLCDGTGVAGADVNDPASPSYVSPFTGAAQAWELDGG